MSLGLGLAITIWAIATWLTDAPHSTNQHLRFQDQNAKIGQDVEISNHAQPARPPVNVFGSRQKQAVQKKVTTPKTNPTALLELITLKGLVGGTTPRAIVYHKRTKETYTVTVGENIGEFTVEAITARSVVLKWQEESFELTL